MSYPDGVNNEGESKEQIVKADEPKKTHEEGKRPLDEITSSVRELAQRLPESIGKLPGSIGAALQNALAGREHSVMVRINDETSKSLDMLVDAGIFANRADAAAFLLIEGIKAQQELFEKVSEKVHQIEKLRSELKGMVGPQ